MSRSLFFGLILLITVMALALRLPGLANRPMHGDEAVNAVKIGELIEGKGYRYDPHEYHGPTLNYFSLIPAWLGGADSFVELSEAVLRIVPVALGLALVLLVLPLREALGQGAVLLSAGLTALSPAMVFYSRYFIHELILVVFTVLLIISGYRCFKSRKAGWAVLAGVSLGLMHATKETFVIAVCAIGLGVIVLLGSRLKNGQWLESTRQVKWSHVAIMIVSAAVVSMVFFSSFFTHPQGIVDSITTYTTYVDRAETSVHVQPWYFYFQLLFFYQFADGPFFTEWIILLLALTGVGVAIRGNVPFGCPAFIQFLAVFTLSMAGVYALIPYKTPWCLLGFYHGMLLLAGVGGMWLLQLGAKAVRVTAIVVLALGSLHLGQQSYASNFQYFSDSRNPHVYGHTSVDVPVIADRIKSMAALHEKGKATPIQVYCPNDDYWPLPWYLRGYQVEFGGIVSEQTPPAPVILIQPKMEEALMRKLYELPPPGQRELYMHLFYNTEDGTVDVMELRPSVELVGFVSRSLFEKQMQQAAEEEAAQ